MTTQETSPAKRQRIAKLMARAGLCSRRDAEAWIVDGRVSVNGAVLTSPALDVSDDDVILVDDEPLPNVEKTRLFLFHKPRGLVTSDHDPEGRETVADYLHQNWPDGPRVVTIGRLDINTEGLLLLTNDGGLARTLELPATGWVRRYRVRAKGTANPADLDALAAGLTIDGIDYAGIEAKLDRVQGANSWLTMGLREGKNREIKRVLEHLGLEVNRLIRLSFGPFQLLDLPEGAVEEVKTRVLRDQLGEKLAEQAGVDFGESAAIVPAPRAERERPPRWDDRKGADARGKPDGARPTPGVRPTRPPPGRSAGRPARRDDRDDAPPSIRERPVAGTRRHVSALRADETEEARKGPRKRIERTDTRDRRDRTVTVERLVAARPAPDFAEGRPPRRPRPDASRDAVTRQRSDGRREASFGEKRAPRRDDARRDRTERSTFGERPRSAGSELKPRVPRQDGPRPNSPRQDRPQSDGPRRDEARGERRHASPSALGKRERMSRSGGAPRRENRPSGDRDERRPARDARPPRAERPDRERSTPRDDRRPAREARPPRTDRSDRSERPATGDARPPRGERPDRTPSGPREDRRAGRGGGERRAGPGANRGSNEDRPKRPRLAGDRPESRRDDKAPRARPAGRPTGAASRKPNNRKPSGEGGPRPSGPRGPGRSGPPGDGKPRGGPSKPGR